MKKRFTAIIISALLLLSSCTAAAGETSSDASQGEDQIEIGMSFDSFVIERWQRDRDVFVSTAKEMGATVNVQSASGDIKKQIERCFVLQRFQKIINVLLDHMLFKMKRYRHVVASCVRFCLFHEL